MNSRDRKLNRRSLLRYSLWGGAGLIGSNAFMNAGRIFNSSQSILQNGLPLDTISLLENALRGGRALFNFEQANAASNDFYLITISCYNSLNSRFLCGAGEIDSTTRNLTAETSVLGNCTDTKAYLEANGVNKVHSNEVFQKLRLTEWWGNMLLNGTMDGKLPAETNVVSGTLKYISPFLSTETSLQIALGMETTSVHSFQNLRLANKDINGLGDLNYYAQSRHQLSPVLVQREQERCLMS